MPQKTRYDVVIIGAGPAGIQAAIHASRKQAEVLVLGRPSASALFRGHIENYAFVEGVVSGSEMLERGRRQAQGFGAEFLEEDLLRADQEGNDFLLKLEGGREIRTPTLILAMGVAKKKLGAPGEQEFLGRGVSYCADCDANFFRGAAVCVTGDRSAAVDGALALERVAAKVTLISRDLRVSEALERQLQGSAVERVEGRIARIHGDNRKGVQAVELEDGRRLEVEGVFIELGSKGAMELATHLGVALDHETMRYIDVNRKQATNVPGVYAAGDITGPPFQMAKAVGEGCVAGMAAADYARDLKRGQDGND